MLDLFQHPISSEMTCKQEIQNQILDNAFGACGRIFSGQ